MRERLGASPLAVQVPVGSGSDFSGVIDLVHMELLVFSGDEVIRKPLDQAGHRLAGPWRERMLEALAEHDDPLMEAYLGLLQSRRIPGCHLTTGTDAGKAFFARFQFEVLAKSPMPFLAGRPPHEVWLMGRQLL